LFGQRQCRTRDAPRTGSQLRIGPGSVWQEKVRVACDLCCCLLPQSEAYPWSQHLQTVTTYTREGKTCKPRYRWVVTLSADHGRFRV